MPIDDDSPAMQRARRYAAAAPPEAKVDIYNETNLVQVVIHGTIEWICVTVGTRGHRTAASAIQSFNSGGKPRRIPVRDITHTIRNLYIDRRPGARG